MNKKYLLLISIISGLLSIYFLNELIKGLTAFLLVSDNVEFTFSFIILKAVFTPETGLSFFSYLLVYTSTVLTSIFLIEITSLLFKKYNSGMVRTQIIIFQLINIGYMLFHLFYGVFTVAFATNLISDWQLLYFYADFSRNHSLVFMLFIILIMFVYIRFSTNRIKNYITPIEIK